MNKLKIISSVFLLVIILGNVKAQYLIGSMGGRELSSGMLVGTDGLMFTQSFTPAINVLNILAVNTTNTTITLNWSAIGSYDHFELFNNNSIIYNGTELNYTDINLTPNVVYPYNLTAYWNDNTVSSILYNVTTRHQHEEIASQSENWDFFWVWIAVYVGVYLFIWKSGYYFVGALFMFANSLLGALLYANAITSLHIFIVATFALIEGMNVLKMARDAF